MTLSYANANYLLYSGAVANVDLGLFSLTSSAVATNTLVSNTNGIGFDLVTGLIQDDSSVLSVDIIGRKLVNSSGTTILDWSDGSNLGVIVGGTNTNGINIDQAILFVSGANIVDWASQVLYDSGGAKAMDFNTFSRQLFDFGGSYPSVDFGGYQLYNIGVSNSVPMLDWGPSSGGSVKIYDGYNGTVNGDFTNHQLIYQSMKLILLFLGLFQLP
jgi:hypothetical protein